MSYLSDFEELNGRYVAFGGNPKGGKISDKGKTRTGKLDFDDVYFVNELKFNLFSVSQMCDKKNSVLFTDTECLVLSPEFKLPDKTSYCCCPKSHVTRPRPAKPIITKLHLPRRHINHIPSPKASNFPPKVTTVKVIQVNTAKGVQGKWEWKPKCLILDNVSCNTSASMTLKRFDYNDALGRSKSDKGVIDSGCSRHMTGNMSYLSDFEELNGRYVAFGGNPKGGKISDKGSGLTWLFGIDTLTKTMIYQPLTACNQSNPSAGVQDNFAAEKAGEENVQQYLLFLIWSSGSTHPQNTNGDATFEVKEPKFEGKKPHS
nr:ribonuclease H-like domain-containing protein [Tanacetum cinerariifolium]